MAHDGFRAPGFSEDEAERLDKLSEVGCINALSAEEVTAAFQKAVSDIRKAMPCESCTHYPQSACDGKPCCACDPSSPYTNCYEEADRNEEEESKYTHKAGTLTDEELVQSVLHCVNPDGNCDGCPFDLGPYDVRCIDVSISELVRRFLKYAGGDVQ